MYEGIKVQNGGNTVDLNNLPTSEQGELILEGVDALKIFLEDGATYSEANFEILDNNNDIKVKFVDGEGNDIFLILRGLNDILLANTDEVPVFEVFEGTETLLSLASIEDLAAAAAGGTSSDVATADATPADQLELGTNLDGPINPLGFGGLAGPFVVDPAYPLDVTFAGDLTATITEDIGESEEGIITGTITNDDPHYGPFGYLPQTITGTFGTFTIDADGNWTYDLDEASTEVQGLADDQSLLDGITITLDNLITTFTINITINGLNDKPEIEAIDINLVENPDFVPEENDNEGSEGSQFLDGPSLQEEPSGPVLYETADLPMDSDSSDEPDNLYTGVINIVDADITNTHIVSIVPDSLNVSDPFNAGIDEDDVSISITQNEETGEWEYSVGGNFNELAVGETATLTFQYQADDQRGFDGDPQDDDTTNEDSLSDIKTITLTVTGTNDQPVVEDISMGENNFWNLVASGASYETIESLNNIVIENESSSPTNGSAIKFTIDTNINETVSFNWDFIDAEGDSSSWNDFSFVIIDGSFTLLEDVIDSDVNGNTLFSHEFISSGSHTITFGVFNSGDTIANSQLNITHVSGGEIVDIEKVGAVTNGIIYETSDENSEEEDSNVITGTLTAIDIDTHDTHSFNIIDTSLDTTSTFTYSDVKTISYDDENNSPSEVDVLIESNNLDVSNFDEMLESIELSNNEVNDDRTANFELVGDFSAIGTGESVTITFTYNADDNRGFGELGDANNEASISETKTVTIVVTGTNDQPEIHFPDLVTQDETTIDDFTVEAQAAYDASMADSEVQKDALIAQQADEREVEEDDAQDEFDDRMDAFDAQQQAVLDTFDVQVPIIAQAAHDAVIASTPEDAEDAYDAELVNSADISAAIAAYMDVINTSEARAQQAYDDSVSDSAIQRASLVSQQEADRLTEEQQAQQAYDNRMSAFDAQQQAALDAFDAQALVDAQAAYDSVQDVITTAVGTITGEDDDYNDLHEISLVSKVQGANSIALVDEAGNPLLVDGEAVYVDVVFNAARNIADGDNAPSLDLDVSDIENLSIVLVETQDGEGTFSYQYTLKGDFNALALDEVATITFDVNVQDDSQDVQGNDFDETDTSEVQTVTVEIVGTNDRPVVLSTQTAPIVETTILDVLSEEEDISTSYTGTILGEDDDLTDEHTIALSSREDANYDANIKVELVAPRNVDDAPLPSEQDGIDLDIQDILNLQINFTEIKDDNGEFEYNYTMSGNFNALAEGEKAIVTFDYVVSDQTSESDENTNSLVQTVTLEITGTNDKPVIEEVESTQVNETTIDSEYIQGLKTAAYDAVMNNEDALAQAAYDEVYNPLEAQAMQDKENAIIQGEAAATQQYLADMQMVHDEAEAAYQMELNDPNSTSFIDAEEAKIATFLEGKAIAVAALTQAKEDVNAAAEQQYLDDLAAAELLAQAAADEVRDNIENTAQAAADAINDDVTIAVGNISGVDQDLTDEHEMVLDDYPLLASGVVTDQKGNYELVTGQNVSVEVISDNPNTASHLVITDITDLGITFEELLDDNGQFSYDYTLSGNFNALGVGDTAIVKFQVHVNDGHSGTGNESGDSDYKEITVTIVGTNDQPIVTDTTASDATVAETIYGDESGPVHATPDFNGQGDGQGDGDKWTWFADTISGTDDDDTDVHDMEIVSLQNVPTDNLININLGNQAQVDAEVTFTQNGSNLDVADIQDGLHLWVTKLSDADGNFEFGYDLRGDFNALGVDETAQIKFAYQINDDSGSSDESQSSELQYVILTITGTNDQPKIKAEVVSEIDMTETVDSDIVAQTVGSIDDVLTVYNSSIADETTIRGKDKDVNDNHHVVVQSVIGASSTIDVQIQEDNPNTNEDESQSVQAEISFSNLNGAAQSPTLSNLSIDFTDDQNTDEGKFKFDYEFKGNFNQLGVGEEATVTINYVVNDGHPTQVAGHESGDTEVQQLVFTITGTNDQPVIENIEAVIATEPDLTVLTENFNESLINSISDDPREGSAVKFTVDTLNGEEVKFQWAFDGQDYLPFNDTAFVIIDGVKTELSDIEEVGNYNDETGMLTLNLHEGTHTITFGVINDNSNDGVTWSSLLSVEHIYGGSNIVESSIGQASKVNGVWNLSADGAGLISLDSFISLGVVTYENAILSGELVETVFDIDTNDVLTFDPLDINSGSGDVTIGGPNAGLVSDVSLTLDADGNYEVTSKSFNDLGYGESVVLTFDVRVDDNSGATNESNFSEYKEVSITITGTNDQPLVNDTKVKVLETSGDNDNMITHTLVSHDEDITDGHDFNLLSIGLNEPIPNGFILFENVKYNSDADTETAFTTEGRVNVFVKAPAGIDVGDEVGEIRIDNVQLNGDEFILNGNFNVLPNGEKATILIKYNVDDLENQVDDVQGNEDSISESKWIKVEVTGTNDVADIFVDSNIGDKDFREVKEDTNINPIYLETDGNLSINDLDFNEDKFNTSDIKFYDPVSQQFVASSPNQMGTLTITNAGYWEYQVENDNVNIQGLKEGQSIQEVFQVKSFDGTDTHDITVKIWGTEDVAVITGVTTGVVKEDGTDQDTITSKAEGNLDVYDKDFGDEEVQPIVSQNGVYGTFSIDSFGDWTYLLDNSRDETQALREGETQTETFTVLSKDGNTSIDVTIDVKGTNDVVDVTAPSQAAILEDSMPVDVLGLMIADVDSNSTMSPTAQYTVQVSVDEGSLINVLPIFTGTLAQVNSYLSGVQYHPDLNFNGTATLSLSVTDDNGVIVLPATTTTIEVQPVNDAPMGANATITMDEDGEYIFGAGDFGFSDPVEGHGFQGVIITNAPVGLTYNGGAVPTGEIAVADLGNLKYEPADDAYGDDFAQIKFKVVDDGGTPNGGEDTSTEHTLTVDVTPVNDDPIAVDDNSGLFNLTLDASNSFTSPDSTITAYNLNGDIVSPIVTGSGLGISGGLDSQIGENGTSAEAIEIKYNHEITDTTVVFSVYSNVYDNGQSKWTIYDNGVVVDSGFITPDNNDTQTLNISSAVPFDTIRLEPVPSDGGNDYYIQSVTSTGIIGLPAQENNILDINVLANDTDIDGGALSITTVDQPSKGSTSIFAGIIKFDPGTDFDYLAAGEKTTVDFEYTISDGNGGSDTATVTVTVMGTNDVPTMVVDSGNVIEDTNISDTGTVVVNDLDAGQSAVQANSENGTYGDFSIGTNGDWTYTLASTGTRGDAVQALNEGVEVSDSFNVTSADGTVTQAVIITITGTNDAPVVAGDNVNAIFTETEGVHDVTNKVKVSDGITLTDIDSISDNIKSATITITNTEAGDDLFYDDILNLFTVTSSVVGGNVVLTIEADHQDGVSSSIFQGALNSIYFTNTSNDPVEGLRDVSFQVVDIHGDLSNVAVEKVLVQATNDIPTVNTDNYIGTFTEALTDNQGLTTLGDPITIVNSNFTISDLDDSNMEKMTITLIGTKPNDSLDYSASGLTVVETSVGGNIVLTITGSATIADYENAIKSITFSNSSDTPDTTPRTVNVVVYDGDNNSTLQTTTINVVPSNDAPIAIDDPSNAPTVLSVEEFDGGAHVDWSSNITAIKSGFGEFLGKFGGNPDGDELVSREYDFGVANANKVVKVEFDMYELGSWDGDSNWNTGHEPTNEHFLSFINGEEVTKDIIGWDGKPGQSDDGGTGGTGSEETHSYTLYVVLDSAGKFTLGFGSQTYESLGNESFGIDNIAISTVPLSTEENTPLTINVLGNDSDPESQALSIVGNTYSPAGDSSITVVSGELVFNPGTDFDYLELGESTQVVFDYTIEDTQGSQDTATVTITVVGSSDNTPPEFVGDDEFDIVEDSSNGAYVGTVQSSDIDGDTVTYSLVDGLGKFEIDEDTGDITFIGNSSNNLDYETQNVYSLAVEINDGEATVQKTYTVDILNLNESIGGNGTIIVSDDSLLTSESNDNGQGVHKTFTILETSVVISAGESFEFQINYTDSGPNNVHTARVFDSSDDLIIANNQVTGSPAIFQYFNNTPDDITISKLELESTNSGFSFDSYEISHAGTSDQVLTLADVDPQGDDIDMHSLLLNVEDFSTNAQPDSLDIIDMSSGDHILSNISVADVFSITDSDNTLKIEMESNDSIELNNTDNPWTIDSASTVGNITTTTYTAEYTPSGSTTSETITLLVEQDNSLL